MDAGRWWVLGGRSKFFSFSLIFPGFDTMLGWMMLTDRGNSQEMFQLIHLAKGPGGWGFDRETVVGLPGAHGSELVRSFCFFDEEQVVFTGGEDGCVKAWRPGS